MDFGELKKDGWCLDCGKDNLLCKCLKISPEINESNSGQRALVRRKTWQELQKAGLLWWINRALHLFGWAIVLVQEGDGTISDAYPARVSWRGFSEKDEEDGFRKVSGYLRANAEMLEKEVGEPRKETNE